MNARPVKVKKHFRSEYIFDIINVIFLGAISITCLLPFMNVFLCDLKHVDPQMMRQETGIDGALILNNIKRLAQSGAQIIARIPVIPDFNDQEEDITNIGQFALDCGIHTINLLPYHRLGLAKHKKIFSTYRPTERRTLADENMNQHLTLLNNMGFTAEII